MIAWILLASLSLGAVVALQEKSPQSSVTQNITFRFNEGYPTFSGESLRLMSFGYSRVVSNLLWLRFLQNSPPKSIEADSVSWVYLDLDAISIIDPEFKPTFESAGIFLSVVTGDKKGAELLLLKGTKLHPDSWRIRGNLAYHYQFELNDKIKAAEQYFAGAKIPGAPVTFAYLGAGLVAREGNVEYSLNFLENMKKNAPDDFSRKRIQSHIDAWKEKYHQGVKYK